MKAIISLNHNNDLTWWELIPRFVEGDCTLLSKKNKQFTIILRLGVCLSIVKKKQLSAKICI